MWVKEVGMIGGGAGFALISMLFLCWLAPRLGLIDHPVGRKVHAAPTPLVGGLSIALAAVLALTLGAVLDPQVSLAFEGSRYIGLIIGAVGLLCLGGIDDRTPLPAKVKLAGQVIFCLGAIFIDGVMIGNIGVHIGPLSLSLGPFLVPVTLLVMVTIINALNMIDGVDGLAAGIAFCALAIMTKAAVAAQFHSEAFLLCALIGAVAGFLLFNFPIWPRRRVGIFLGDGGTLLLGFLVAYFAISLSAVPHRVFRPSTAIWFFFIPVADAMLLYLRRTLMDRAPFRPGRDHIHHIVLHHLPPWLATWVLVTASAALAGTAYAAERLGVRPIWLLSGWIVLFVCYAAITQSGWRAAWLRSHQGPAAPAETDQPQDAPRLSVEPERP